MITAASVGAPQPGLDRESQALRLQADLLCTAVWQWSPTSSLVTGHFPPPGEQLAVLPPPCNTTPLGPHLRLAPGAHGGLAGLRPAASATNRIMGCTLAGPAFGSSSVAWYARSAALLPVRAAAASAAPLNCFAVRYLTCAGRPHRLD